MLGLAEKELGGGNRKATAEVQARTQFEAAGTEEWREGERQAQLVHGPYLHPP